MACDAPAPAQAQASRRPRAAAAAAPRPLRQVALRVWLLSAALLSSPLLPGCLAVPRARDYLKLAGRAGAGAGGAGGAAMARPWGAGAPGREPSCEELLAMWRFSKRQSRATEITNEIAQYRDPFAYNVWEPHARSRSAAGAAIKGARGAGRHVYGRVVHAAPRSRARMDGGGGASGGGGGGGGGARARAYEEVARHLVAYPGGAAPPPPLPPRRRLTAFRFSGGGADPHVAIAPQAGSFQQLKDIIRSERARELQAQRLAEEAAARAAALRDVGLGPAPPPPGDEHIRFGRRSLPAAAPAPDDRDLDDDDEDADADAAAAADDEDLDEEDAYAKYSEFLAHAVPYGG